MGASKALTHLTVLKVSPEGRVSSTEIQVPHASPGGPLAGQPGTTLLKEEPTTQKKIDSMVSRIEKILAEAAATDRIASRALRTLVKDSHNFSSVEYTRLGDMAALTCRGRSARPRPPHR